jgi:hypothetical protein
MMRSEGGLELFPGNHMVGLERGHVAIPPEACCASQLLSCKPCLVRKWVVRLAKQRRLGTQEVLILGSLRLVVLMSILLIHHQPLDDLTEQLGRGG